jgi:hypothetical protein
VIFSKFIQETNGHKLPATVPRRHYLTFFMQLTVAANFEFFFNLPMNIQFFFANIQH